MICPRSPTPELTEPSICLGTDGSPSHLPAWMFGSLCLSWGSPALKDQTQAGVLCCLQWLCFWKPGATVCFCTKRCGALGKGL